jgi:preprotein translocase SecE subunit
MALVAMFGCYRLFHVITASGAGAETAAQEVETVNVIGLSVPVAAFWGGGVFIVLAGIIAVLTLGVETPSGGINKVTHAFNDLLIDTQTELAKVVWPTWNKLVRATGAVITTVVILGVFLWFVDTVMKSVLPVLIQGSQ